MEILGIIPARGGSKGVPGKNIRPLAGKPLIAYSIEAAAASKRLSRTVLTTDSEEIADVGRCYRVDVPFIRPAELASDESAATDYIDHCLDFLQREQSYLPQLVVLLQPTSPFRSGSDIDACIDMLLDSDADSVVSVAELPLKYHPDWQFSVSGEGLLSPCSGRPWGELTSGRQQLQPTYTRNGAVYVFRSQIYRELNNIYGSKVLAYIMPPERSVNIDDMEDWRQAEAVITTDKTRN